MTSAKVTLVCMQCKIELPFSAFYLRNMFDLHTDSPWGMCNGCLNIKKKKPQTRTMSEEYKAKSRESYRSRRKRVISHYGSMCECCGETAYEFLALDHKNKDGYAQRKKGIGSGARFLRLIEKMGFPEEYRILCHNCNSSIGYYGYCPHQQSKEMISEQKKEAQPNP